VVCFTVALVGSRLGAIHAAAPVVEPELVSPPVQSGDLVAEVIVKEIRIAESKDFTELHASFPHKWERFVVRFEMTKVLKGRVAQRELTVLVHSPSRDLKGSQVGQRGVLHWYQSGGIQFDPS
jgi:hypothetical protein